MEKRLNMGLFDRFRNFVDKALNRAPRAVPNVEPEIMDAFDVQPNKPKSVVERVRDVFKKAFRPKEEPVPEAEFVPIRESVTEGMNLDPFNLGLTEPQLAERKQKIFEFRRNTEDEGHLFYRLTQWIWDRAGVAAKDRDAAIVKYYNEKYGISDMNEIYDLVLSENAELLERYRNARTPGEKYEIMRNIKVTANNA